MTPLTNVAPDEPHTNVAPDEPLTNVAPDEPLTNVAPDEPLTNVAPDEPLTNVAPDELTTSRTSRDPKALTGTNFTLKNNGLPSSKILLYSMPPTVILLVVVLILVFVIVRLRRKLNVDHSKGEQKSEDVFGLHQNSSVPQRVDDIALMTTSKTSAPAQPLGHLDTEVVYEDPPECYRNTYTSAPSRFLGHVDTKVVYEDPPECDRITKASAEYVYFDEHGDPIN
ncbi:hypothetical protein FHG87_007938 [Trinorchestia longiramus]|nr:hypothetical protein FHG87_007938 [Trinorchestia longiramus]